MFVSSPSPLLIVSLCEIPTNKSSSGATEISFAKALLLLDIVYRGTITPDNSNIPQSLSDLNVFKQIGQNVQKNK